MRQTAQFTMRKIYEYDFKSILRLPREIKPHIRLAFHAYRGAHVSLTGADGRTDIANELSPYRPSRHILTAVPVVRSCRPIPGMIIVGLATGRPTTWVALQKAQRADRYAVGGGGVGGGSESEPMQEAAGPGRAGRLGCERCPFLYGISI